MSTWGAALTSAITSQPIQQIGDYAAHACHHTSCAPQLKARIWYGMPGYALSASRPVVVFFRNDELMTFGISEKAELKPARGKDGLLIPAAWCLEEFDEVTE